MIKNAKFSGNYFYINLSILEDFQICISVPLSSGEKPVYTVKILLSEQNAFAAVLYFEQVDVVCGLINKSVSEWFLLIMCK